MKNKIMRNILFLVIISFVFSSMGCETLRKKFIREKKKKEENTIVPLLEPIDYPEKVITPIEMYQKHYGLWQVWSKDLLAAIDENKNDKRILFLMQQMISELKGMQQCILEEKQNSFEPLINDLESVNKELSKPQSLRNMNLIKNRLEQIFKAVRVNLKLKQVQNIFRNIP